MQSKTLTRRGMIGAGVATAGSAIAGRAGAAPAGELTAGFIYVGSRDDFGYNQSHAEAAATLKSLPGIKILEEERVPETDSVETTMQSMIDLDGATLLFPTSFGYFDPYLLRTARRYPSVQFRHCGGLWAKDKHPLNAGSYFGYIGMAQYLSGIVAGHMTRSKKIGFVAAKPIPLVLKNINSFALGARSVDASVTTTVIFTGDWSMPVREAEATHGLADAGIDVVACHVDAPKVIVQTAESRGLYTCGFHVDQSALAPNGYLTGAEWNWATIYRMYLRAAAGGQALPNSTRGGLAEGYVRTSAYGRAASQAARHNADAVRAEMMKGGYTIFRGPLRDNRGREVLPAGTAYPETAVELESTDYLVEGVLGSIP